MSELAWIEALRADRVLNTPALVPANDGSLICGFEHSGERRDVVAFEYVCGREPDTADDLVFWFERLGMISANLHLHSRKWNRPEGFVRKSWTYETILGEAPLWGSWRCGLGLDADGTKILEQTESILGKQLDAYGMGHDRFGLIHADLRLANLLVDGENLSDFDDCGLSLL
jgi:Ser/Thr protein kinase RdoA (MazF antagonist)